MAAEVKTVFTADDRDMIKSLEKQVAAQKRVNEGLQKQVTSLKSVKKATGDTRKEAASGASAFIGMGKAIALMGGAAAMFRGITSEISLMNKEAKSGAEALAAQIGSLKDRGQVTTSAKDTRFLEGIDKAIATSTSIGGLLKARQFVTKVRSIATIKDSELGDMRKVIDAEGDAMSLLDAIAQAQSLFPGQTGNALQVANKLTVGGAQSKTSAGVIATGIAGASEGLLLAGLDDEAAITGVSALTTPFKTPEKAGTKLGAIGSIAAMGGIRNAKSIPELIDRMSKDKKIMKTLMGQREVFGAFEIIRQKKNLDELRKVRALVDEQNVLSGTEFDAVSLSVQRNMSSPAFRVARNESMRKGREDVRSAAEAIRGEPYADVSQRFNERLSNEGMIERIVERSLATFASLFGRGAGTIIREGIMVSPLTNQQPQDPVNDIPMPVGSWPSAAAGYRRPASPFITAPGPIRTESAVE